MQKRLETFENAALSDAPITERMHHSITDENQRSRETMEKLAIWDQKWAALQAKRP